MYLSQAQSGDVRSAMAVQSDGAYVEDLKDPIEVRPPGRDSILIVLCVEMPRNSVSFSLLDDPLLDLRHSPEVRSEAPLVSFPQCVQPVQLTSSAA